MSKTDYRRGPWKIHALADDFRLLDAWELPITLDGSEADFLRACEFVTTFNPTEANVLVRALFQIRLKLGARLGWDGPGTWGVIPGTTQTSIGVRLSADERAMNKVHLLPRATDLMSEFKPVYVFGNEALSEISNRTIYALLHIGMTPQHRLAMGVFVKSRGRLSDAYMAAIGPFRHLVVYPLWFRAMAAGWSRLQAGH